jgi:hypothetical protein
MSIYVKSISNPTKHTRIKRRPYVWSSAMDQLIAARKAEEAAAKAAAKK